MDGDLFIGENKFMGMLLGFRNEIQLTVFMGTALVDLYGKTGCLSSASNVFEKMTVKEVCTWNTMISALNFFEW